jgi:peptidoglycan/xylan/chitin deacetylase (PgdA/CDA1 family)
LSPFAIVDELCLDWDELGRLARHPLAAIGCHTLTHPRLSHLPLAEARQELTASRRRLEAKLGRPVATLAYPYGMRSAAAAREYELATELGFTVGVTTEPGVLRPAQLARLTALPRISVNGLWQELAASEVLLSGAAFPVWSGAAALARAAGISRPTDLLRPAAPSIG